MLGPRLEGPPTYLHSRITPHNGPSSTRQCPLVVFPPLSVALSRWSGAKSQSRPSIKDRGGGGGAASPAFLQRKGGRPGHSWGPLVQYRIYDSQFSHLLGDRGREGEGRKGWQCEWDECAGLMQCLVTRLKWPFPLSAFVLIRIVCGSSFG